jgi:hypothetical protein
MYMLGPRILFPVPVSVYLQVVHFFVNFLYFSNSFSLQLSSKADIRLDPTQEPYTLDPVALALTIALEYQKVFPNGGETMEVAE